MGSTSRAGAIVLALFGSIPITVFVMLIIRELFVYVNGGTALDPLQMFQTFFAGFAFGLAAFTCLYACRVTIE